MQNAKKLIAALLVLGIVGRMDYEDAVAQHEHCLTMVEAGSWPAEVCA